MKHIILYNYEVQLYGFISYLLQICVIKCVIFEKPEEQSVKIHLNDISSVCVFYVFS